MDKNKLFEYCVGNPPYQADTSNMQLWPSFILSSIKTSEQSCFVHPASWVVPKKSMKNITDEMVKSGLMKFKLWQDYNKIFPTIRRLEGGVSITYFKTGYKDKITFILNDTELREYIPTGKIFLNDFEEEIFTKVFKNIDTDKNMLPRVLGNIGSLGACDFGYEKVKMLSEVKLTPDGMTDPIQVYTNDSIKKATGKYIWGYIEKDKLSAYPEKLFSSRKVMVSKVGDPLFLKNASCVIGKGPIICDKMMTTQINLFIFPEQDTDRDLQLIKSLFMTKTARYLMTISQKTMYVRGFENVPDYLELAKLLPEDQLFTDEWFYKTFDFSQALIDDIEKRVSEKV